MSKLTRTKCRTNFLLHFRQVNKIKPCVICIRANSSSFLVYRFETFTQFRKMNTLIYQFLQLVNFANFLPTFVLTEIPSTESGDILCNLVSPTFRFRGISFWIARDLVPILLSNRGSLGSVVPFAL